MYIHATGVLLGLWSEPRKRGHVSDSRSLRANRLSFRPHVQPEYELPPRPPRFTLSHARALRKLIVREAVSLSSPICGSVAAGTSVMVLEKKLQVGRIYIAAAFVDGVHPLGCASASLDLTPFGLWCSLAYPSLARPVPRLACSPPPPRESDIVA